MDEFNKALRVAAKMKPDTFSFIEYEDDTPDDNNSTFMRRLPVGTDGARGWQEFRYPFEMSGDDIDTLAGLFGRIIIANLDVGDFAVPCYYPTIYDMGCNEVLYWIQKERVKTQLETKRQGFSAIMRELYPDEFK